MPTFTLLQVMQRASKMLGENFGTVGNSSPMLYVDLCQQAADELAQDLSIYGGNASADVVANQPLYSAPTTLTSITGAYYTDSAFNKNRVTPQSTNDMDQRYPQWRNFSTPVNNISGTPQYYVTLGLNQILLWPVPNISSYIFGYSDLIISNTNIYQISSAAQRTFTASDAGCALIITGGTGFTIGRYDILSVAAGIATVNEPLGTAGSTAGIATLSIGGMLYEGFLTPGQSWGGVFGTSSYAPNQTCPLPPIAHMAVVYRTAILRCIQFPTKDNLIRLPMLEKGFLQQYELVESAATRWNANTRHGDRRSRVSFGGGYG